MQLIGGSIVLGALLTLALLLRFARSRAWLIRLGSGLSNRFGRPEHTPEWEREHAELWLMARRRQLMTDLRRIESLLVHDEWMSATRQLGNRLARDQLIASLARIPELVPARDRYFGYDVVTPVTWDVAPAAPRTVPAPLTVSAPLAVPTPMADRRPSVEVLDVVGW